MIHTAITIISCLALVVLLIPLTRWGILIGIPLLFVTAFFAIRSKSQNTTVLRSKRAILTAALLLTPSAALFFMQWLPSYMVGQLAQMLRLPSAVPVAAATGLLWAGAVFVTAGFLRRTGTILTPGDSSGFIMADLTICLILAVLSVVFGQTMIAVPVLYMGVGKFLLGTAAVFVLFLIIYTLTGQINTVALLGMGTILLVSTVNVYVLRFRDRLFEPVDLFTTGTVINVVGNYNFLPVPLPVLHAWRVWALFCYGLSALPATCRKRSISGKKRWILAACCLAGMLSVCSCVKDLRIYHWNMEGAYLNGYVLDFISKFKELKPEKPEAYDSVRIAQRSEPLTHSPDPVLDDDVPHIIVIMDEAFSDLNVHGEIRTNKDVTPFFSALKADTISGYALASVHGGNTANSEYEFLTGNTMAWLPENAVPYQQYIRSPAYSMVSYLKSSYDYRCIAMHPYFSSGWNRPAVYEHFGFDETFFDVDFPRKHYIRDFISDREMFETIVDVYEQNKEQPLFLFGITMQNHGDYQYHGANFKQDISLVGYDGDYSEVEQYLSLIHETDRALEYLISYFENADDKVVIVFFGDHQPSLETPFFEAISGSPSAFPQTHQRRYAVPFCIWANYDIDEQYMECTSLNYLSSYVYEAAGIPLPPYNQLLREIETAIPAINAHGFYSRATQNFESFDMASEEERTWLLLYEQLQYNSLFDAKNRNEKLFPVLH